MEWLIFIAGAVAYITVKGFISYLSLVVKHERKQREIVRLEKVVDMYAARNTKLESMVYETALEPKEWPEQIG